MPARSRAHHSTHTVDAPRATATDGGNRATPSSIAAARAAQQREREEFSRVTGIRLDRHGRPILTARLVHRKDDAM